MKSLPDQNHGIVQRGTATNADRNVAVNINIATVGHLLDRQQHPSEEFTTWNAHQ
jgi:hypothetical protein